MRCRFCDTEIADKAIICFRCGRATTDARVAPPPLRRGPSGVVTAAVVVVSGAAAAYLPELADHSVLWAGWAGLTALAGVTTGAWWRGRR
ncbi:MAG: hypothetical protein ABI880_14095 [Acidobacteriota bacterium]